MRDIVNPRDPDDLSFELFDPIDSRAGNDPVLHAIVDCLR